eukprot:CAMPEP_0119315672 /NCGR_PEP_ID=MMETSP1333-20130426/36745_1 /TAXON_ID=418940 /ORGANISM="Scyphosphaera apsteinii, Strain RCC1455" /LENGTH=347 /DNA_ID=CAMNT_0007321111 /DNA_START=55 /DNA_END=1098 /DNA_ORIENTATION=-
MRRCCLLLAAAATTSAELTQIRLGLEWFLNPDHLPFVVALCKGYFAEAELAVSLVEPADHWEAEQEIMAGRLDVAVTETLHLAQDAAAGKPVLGFSRFLHTDGGVMFLAGSNITRPSDMCGRTISYPGSPGPGGPAIVQTMVEADGGACDLASYGKHNGGFYHTQALSEKKADLATLIFYNFEVIEAENLGLRPGFFSLKEWGVPDFCQLVLFTTPERFHAMQPALRKFVLAVRRATGFIHREPTRAAEIFKAHVVASAPPPTKGASSWIRRLFDSLNPVAARKRRREAKVEAATITATLPAFPNDNSIAESYFVGLMAWLVKTGQVDQQKADQVPPSTYWTNSISL